MKLIEDWRRAWRYISVQAMLLAGAVQAAWEGFSLKDDVPDYVRTGLTLFLLTFGIGGRLIKQKRKPKKESTE